MSELKAIETVYNGYRFRSRLEARWAVFFDSLGIKYQYEPETFDLDGIWYIPDFWLPQLKCWIEIKPDKPLNKLEWQKITRLQQISGQDTLLIQGEPKIYETHGDSYRMRVINDEKDTMLYERCYWAQCLTCLGFGLVAEGIRAYLGDHKKSCLYFRPIDNSELLKTAYFNAIQVRFEDRPKAYKPLIKY